LALLKRWRVGLIGLVVSLLAVYFVVTQINVGELGATFQRVRWGWVLLCAALLALGLVTRAWRWRVLLSDGLPLGRAFGIMNVAYLVNGILPLRIGEVARAYLATRARRPVPVFKSLGTIIVERLLDLLMVVGLIAIALALGPLPNELRAAALVFGPVALAGFLFLVFLASRRALAQRLLDGLTSRVPLLARLNVPALVGHFLDGLAPLTRSGALASALALTLLSWALSVAAGYVLMFAVWDTADLATTCLFIAAAALAIAVPAVPGNVGTYELSILLALQATGYGEPATTAGAFAILVHGVNLVVYAVFGVAGFVQEGISLEQLTHGVQGMQRATNAELKGTNV
jgi:glycosyltransferase 2 family protein